MKVLFRAVDRIEGIVVPDVPTYRHRRLGCLYRFVDCGVGLAKAVSPKHFPGCEFGIPQQKPPELNVVPVHGAFAGTRGANEFFQLQKSPAGALDIDALLFRFAPAELAEAGHISWVDRRRVVRGSQAVRECTLTL